MQKARIALKIVKNTYGIFNNIYDEDMMQDAILWLIENGGAIEKNFSNYPHIIDKNIFNILRKYMTLRFLNTFKLKVKSLNERLTPKKKADKAKEGDELGSRIASPYNLEEEVIDRATYENTDEEEIDSLDFAERCIREMQLQIQNGLSKPEILSNMEVKFKLSKEELLQLMQNYLINKGKVKVIKNAVSWTGDER